MLLSISFSIQSKSNPNNQTKFSYFFFFFNPKPGPFTTHCFSSDSCLPDFSPAQNAYDILGVSETSSFTEIKSSFRKLAKLTHPDLADSSPSSSSRRFIQILAAYEILSDSERRAHYDSYLLSQRIKSSVQKNSKRGDSILRAYNSRVNSSKEMEVVEWLKWYRLAVDDILAERKVATGTGFVDELEADFYSAIRMAYYGPVLESIELLPDRFEAEERSVCETPEVLHLVSGRDLFGMVCLANKNNDDDDNCRSRTALSFSCNRMLDSNSFNSVGLGVCRTSGNNVNDVSILGDCSVGVGNEGSDSDAYKDLELHLSGRVVAIATRVPPKGVSDDGVENEDGQDKIHVFLSSEDNSMDSGKGFLKVGGGGLRIPLGTIMGLGTSPEEGSCFVYDHSGTKTHLIMKHRTLMVKHLHWYGVGDKVSVCECRCTRARLPPSKFWLFEPRCGMHDIGGWYVETFGKDKKGRTAPAQRHWDGFNGSEEYDKRLHPAMYLLALAYRTLDLEDAKRRKLTVRTIVEGQLSRLLHWCKKLV